MSKEQRSNKEKKKPKADKGVKQPSAYKSSQGQGTPSGNPFAPKKK